MAEFLKALLAEGLQVIVMGAAAFGAILLGIRMRKKKNSVMNEEKE